MKLKLAKLFTPDYRSLSDQTLVEMRQHARAERGLNRTWAEGRSCAAETDLWHSKYMAISAELIRRGYTTEWV